MKISEYLDEELINADLKSHVKVEVLEELSTILSAKYKELKKEEVIKVLTEREKLGSTGIGMGVAIPHGKLKIKEDKLYIAIGVSKEGVEFDSMDGNPVNIFFVLLAPEQSTKKHLQALAKISRILKKKPLRDAIISSGTSSEILKIIKEEDEKI